MNKRFVLNENESKERDRSIFLLQHKQLPIKD